MEHWCLSSWVSWELGEDGCWDAGIGDGVAEDGGTEDVDDGADELGIWGESALGGEGVGTGAGVDMSGRDEDEGKVSWKKVDEEEEDWGEEAWGEEDEGLVCGVTDGGGCGGGREGSLSFGKSAVRRARRRGGRTVLVSRKWVAKVCERNLDRRLG